MGIPLKLTPAQRDKLMNDAIHYDVSMQFISKENMWECVCDAATAMKVKKVVDEPAPPKG